MLKFLSHPHFEVEIAKEPWQCMLDLVATEITRSVFCIDDFLFYLASSHAAFTLYWQVVMSTSKATQNNTFPVVGRIHVTCMPLGTIPAYLARVIHVSLFIMTLSVRDFFYDTAPMIAKNTDIMRLNERTIASLPDVNSHFSRGATRFVFISLGSRIDIVEPKSSHLAQMRILILGHLQNAMRREKKTNCYCIFELMGCYNCYMLQWVGSFQPIHLTIVSSFANPFNMTPSI